MGKDSEKAAATQKKHGHVSAKLLTLAAIAEGFRKGKDIRRLYDWSKEKCDDVLNDLHDKGYIVKAKEGADEARDAALEITEKGREQMPQLMDELGDATRAFLQEVQTITKKHFKEVVPDIEFNISVKSREQSEED